MKIKIMLLVLLSITGCAGIKFSDETVNKNLPSDFKNRNIYPETDIFKYKMDSLAGRILVCQPDQIKERIYDCDLKITRILKKDKKTKSSIPPETLTPERLVYSSKIDKGASAQGSYLAFAGSFSAEQAAEIIITDSALVYVDDDNIPEKELKKYVRANPKKGKERRFWIQGALLATIYQRDLVKIDANAEGVVGNTSGIKGKVYNHRGQESVDYRISLLMPDIDRDLDKSSLVRPENKNHGIILRSINGIENLEVDAVN